MTEMRPPALPGFREMAERLETAASGRADLVRDLTARRTAAGLTQADVAALMGTSQPAVARLEAGAGDLRASTLERYAAAVGASIDWKFSALRRGAGPMTHSIDRSGTPGSPGNPGIPGTPGVPGSPGTPWQPRPHPDPPGQVSPTRVWLDQDQPLTQRLLDQRIVLAAGILDDDAATRLSAQFLTLDAEAATPIRLELQNLRAELPAALTVMGVLDTLRAEVAVHASGLISGPALGLLAACPVRLGYPNSSFGFSEPRIDLGGVLTASALAAREQQVQRMLDSLWYRIAEVTGHDASEIREAAHDGRTLTVAEAIGYGLLTARTDPNRAP
jgi:ATP-dependent protease ClpP protease subunit